MQDKDNSYNTVGFGKANADEELPKEFSGDFSIVDTDFNLHNEKTAKKENKSRNKKRGLLRRFIEFWKYNEEITVKDALGEEKPIPDVI